LCISLKSEGETVHKLGKERSTASVATCHCCAEPASSRIRDVELENDFHRKGEILSLWRKVMGVVSLEFCSVPGLEQMLFL